MEKTIKVSKDQSMKLSNNISWMFIYRNQFGKDIVPVLVPAMNAMLELYGQVIEAAGEGGITTDVMRRIPVEDLQSAVIELSGLEATELIQIIWAMAYAADESIEPPMDWLRQFETFPLDVILPEAVSLIAKGLISSKNLRGLRKLTEATTN